MGNDVTPLEWGRLLVGPYPPLFYAEIALRILMLLALLLLVVHILGKRGQQNLSPMQQLLMVALGSAAGDVMLYPEISIGYAAMVLVGVTGLTIVIEKSANHSRKFRDYLESRPCVLVQDGEIDLATLKRERTTRRELYAILRQNGARALSQVELAILEVTGEITVVLNDSKPEKRDLIDYLRVPGGKDSPAAVKPGVPV
ncbi:YetF domain-containing protein [Lysobacter sp. A03]|uniref:DUF421 domain-containing protein n=1 Tax=Lysobacter sp. A03 TaxID=1199154 RepID=UPI0005B6D423|nr:YetF domain-containing protein [Lysobacter sp. A03]KIQ97534.1 putative membrane protein [Lysobacter sp. A03]